MVEILSGSEALLDRCSSRANHHNSNASEEGFPRKLFGFRTHLWRKGRLSAQVCSPIGSSRPNETGESPNYASRRPSATCLMQHSRRQAKARQFQQTALSHPKRQPSSRFVLPRWV